MDKEVISLKLYTVDEFIQNSQTQPDDQSSENDEEGKKVFLYIL